MEERTCIGIIAEFDPFHRGHAHLIAQAKAALPGAPVVCAMSGPFTQRGEAAIVSKYARAEMALRCGADLVVELPVQWAVSSAESFARGGVQLLHALGVTHLAFGSESGDLTATVAQYPYEIGVLGVQACEAALAGTEIPTEVESPTALVNKDNAADALAAFPAPFEEYENPLAGS